jgi:hypothetical protein
VYSRPIFKSATDTGSARRGARRRMAGFSVRRGVAPACFLGACAVALASLGGTAQAMPTPRLNSQPQPELKPFVIGTANGASAVTTDGYNETLIVAYVVSTPNTDGAIQVCVLKLGARSCASQTTLNTVAGSSLFDSPLVSVEPGGSVIVAMDECCGAPDQLFTSTNGGQSFGAPVPIGPANAPNITVSETFNEGMKWAENDAGAEFAVEYAAVGDPGAGQSVTAMTDPADFSTAGLGSYSGGVIAAGSDSNDVTFASFAPAGSMVFAPLGQFSSQQLIAVSGQSMVTQLTSGSQSLEVRRFNGTTFGPPSVVPYTGGGGPNWNTAYQTPAGQTFIFTERNQDSYDLEMQSTTSGSSWSARTDLGNAVKSNEFAAALFNAGNGAVVGTTGPATVFPVLAPQPVSFKLSKSSVASGTAVKATGKGSSAAAGRTVTLQQFQHGAWTNIATTHEKASGSFSFAIAEHDKGSDIFRARVADRPGYLEYGYSRPRTLTVT